MTGISVLFNMNTEEACYIYGNMDTYRRMNGHRFTSGSSSLGRRSISDRYGGSTDLIHSFAPTYSDTLPRYHSNRSTTPSASSTSSSYGSYHTGWDRGSYSTSSSYTPGLSGVGTLGVRSGIYSDLSDPVMSKYSSSSRSYDRATYDRPPPAPHHETSAATSTRSHDTSSRLYSRGSRTPDSDCGGKQSSRPNFGISYGGGKSSETSTGTGDVTGSRSGDVTPRSPTRIASSSGDRQREKLDLDSPSESSPRRQIMRQRVNSGDSVGSLDSNPKGEDTLFSSYKNRYTERIVDPNSSSNWRLSRTFDDDSLHQGLAVRDRRDRIHEGDSSSEGSWSRDRSRSADQQRSRERESSGGHSSKIKVKDRHSSLDEDHHRDQVLPEKAETGSRDADDLIFNFRQALRRHAQSEEGAKKNSSDGAEKVRHTKEPTKEDQRPLKLGHVEESDEESQLVQEPERDEVRTGSLSDKQKAGHKLARQKLVSNDLKAKYIENKQEKTEKPEEENSSSRKSSPRRKVDPEEERQQMLGTVLPVDEIPSLQSCKEAYFRSAQQSKIERPPSDIPSSMREPSPSRKHTERISSLELEEEHDDAGEEERSVVLEEPTISLKKARERYSAASDKEHEPFGFIPGEPRRDVSETEQSDASVSREKSARKTPRKFKRYTKSKSLELGQLSQSTEGYEPKQEPEPVTQDDISVGKALTMDEIAQLERKDRIARYKEERRKQLATLTARFGEEGQENKAEFPSLFLTAASASPDRDLSPLARSKSLRQESDNKVDSPQSVSRSKSLKAHSSQTESVSPSSPDKGPSLSGLHLAELASIPSDAEKEGKQYNTDNIIDRLQALRKLRLEHLKQEGKSADELQSKHLSKEDDFNESSAQQKIALESLGLSTKSLALAERQHERARKETERKHSDRDSDSGRESSDSHRVRRRLPSLEDVLGTKAIPASQPEKKQEAKFQRHIFAHKQKDQQGASEASSRTESLSSQDTKVKRSDSDKTDKVKARQRVPETNGEVFQEFKPFQFGSTQQHSQQPALVTMEESSKEAQDESRLHSEPDHKEHFSKDKDVSEEKKETPSVSTELQRLILQEDAEEDQRRERARQMMLGFRSDSGDTLERDTDENVAKIDFHAEDRLLQLERKKVADSFVKHSPRTDIAPQQEQKSIATKLPSPSLKRKEQKPPSSPQSERKHPSKMPTSPRSGSKHVAPSLSKPNESDGVLSVYQAQSSPRSPEVKDLKQFVEVSEKQEGFLHSSVRDSTVAQSQHEQSQTQLQESYFARKKEEMNKEREAKQTVSVRKDDGQKSSVLVSAKSELASQEADEEQDRRAPSNDHQNSKPTKISFRDKQSQVKKEGAFEMGTTYAKPAETVAMGTSYTKPAETVAIGTTYTKPAETVAIGTSYTKPAETVSTGTSYAKPAETISMGTSYTKPAETVSMGTSYTKPAETISMGTSYTKPAETVAMGTSYTKPAETISMGTSYTKPAETVAMGTSYTKPAETVAMGSTYTKPAETISMGSTYARPAETVAMGTTYTKPAETVAMGTTYTKPAETVAMGTSYTKPAETVAMGTSYTKPAETVAMGTSYTKPAETVSMGTSYTKPAETVAMGTSYTKPAETVAMGTSYTKPAETVSMGTSYTKASSKAISMGTSYSKPAATEPLTFRTDYIDKTVPEPESPSRVSTTTLQLSSAGPDKSTVRTISHRDVIELAKQSKMETAPMTSEEVSMPLDPATVQQDNRLTKSIGLKEKVIATATGQGLEAPPSPRKQQQQSSNIAFTTQTQKFDQDRSDMRSVETQQIVRQDPVYFSTIQPQSSHTGFVAHQPPPPSVNQAQETPPPSPGSYASKKAPMSPAKIEKFLDSLAAKSTPKAPSVVTLSSTQVAPAPVSTPAPAPKQTPAQTPAHAPTKTLVQPPVTRKAEPSPTSTETPVVNRQEVISECQSEHEEHGPFFQGLLTPLAQKLEMERLKEESMDPKDRASEFVKRELTLEEELNKKIEKQKEDQQILDSSLDDILNRNADYLSDLEPPEFSRSRNKNKKKAKRPLSVHDPPVKTRRVLRKKISRSKSEDRSQFKGKLSDSDDDLDTRRSKATEDMRSKVGGTLLSELKSVKDSLKSPKQ